MKEIEKTVYSGGVGEVVEKKSRFIATIQPCETKEEAEEFIASMKKKYWDARHNCSAFIIGRNQLLTRCSDDGEPAQTAGKPMLSVLEKEHLYNVAVVVTRYFGGTLLGTGGLVRAYQGAVQEALKNCIIIEKQQGQKAKITTDYVGYGKIQYAFASEKEIIVDTVFEDVVYLHTIISNENKQKMEKLLLEITDGTLDLQWEEPVEYAYVEKNLKIF